MWPPMGGLTIVTWRSEQYGSQRSTRGNRGLLVQKIALAFVCRSHRAQLFGWRDAVLSVEISTLLRRGDLLRCDREKGDASRGQSNHDTCMVLRVHLHVRRPTRNRDCLS